MILPLDILFEDNHLIVINKRSGDIVQGDITGDEPLSDKVKQYIKVKYEKPGDVYLGVVHRLDRPVTGITVFARTSKAAERLSKMFVEHKIQKTYWAIIEDKPELEVNTLTHYLIRYSDKNITKAFNKQVAHSKLAVLDYQLIANVGKFYLLQVALHTGRHHQIRAQLSKIGCSIKGDVKYGSKRSNDDNSICLHARHIKFEHPVNKQIIQFTSPIPQNQYWNLFSEYVKQVNNIIK